MCGKGKRPRTHLQQLMHGEVVCMHGLESQPKSSAVDRMHLKSCVLGTEGREEHTKHVMQVHVQWKKRVRT